MILEHKAVNPKATAQKALEYISALHQYEAIDDTQRRKMTESVTKLMAIKTNEAKELLKQQFLSLSNGTNDRIVKNMCERFVAQM